MIEQGCDEFIQVDEKMNVLELATMINQKNIQILFNLNGWTQGERTDVFVLRPAPI
jgi:predicted O-linked N-acetylglucosamine transferase (SPINDLY family)